MASQMKASVMAHAPQGWLTSLALRSALRQRSGLDFVVCSANLVSRLGRRPVPVAALDLRGEPAQVGRREDEQLVALQRVLLMDERPLAPRPKRIQAVFTRARDGK